MNLRDETVLRAKAGDPASIAEFYAGIRRMLAGHVHQLVSRRSWLADLEEDLEQEAAILALRAMRRFDPSRGVRATTFIYRSVSLGLRPIALALGAAAGVHFPRCSSVRDEAAMRRALQGVVSLSEERGVCGETLGDALEARPRDSAEASIDSAEIATAVRAALAALSPLCRDVVSRRFGLGGRSQETLPGDRGRPRVLARVGAAAREAGARGHAAADGCGRDGGTGPAPARRRGASPAGEVPHGGGGVTCA